MLLMFALNSFCLETKLTFVLYSSDLQGHMETVCCDVVLKLLQRSEVVCSKRCMQNTTVSVSSTLSHGTRPEARSFLLLHNKVLTLR